MKKRIELHTQRQAEESAAGQGESEMEAGAGGLSGGRKALPGLRDNVIFCPLLRSGEFTAHINSIRYRLRLLFDILSLDNDTA